MPFCIDCAESLQEGYDGIEYRIIVTTDSRGKVANVAWDSKVELMGLKQQIEANFDPKKETMHNRHNGIEWTIGETQYQDPFYVVRYQWFLRGRPHAPGCRWGNMGRSGKSVQYYSELGDRMVP